MVKISLSSNYRMTEWLDLVIRMKDSNPDLTFKEVLIKAKKEYRKMNSKKNKGMESLETKKPAKKTIKKTAKKTIKKRTKKKTRKNTRK